MRFVGFHLLQDPWLEFLVLCTEPAAMASSVLCAVISPSGWGLKL